VKSCPIIAWKGEISCSPVVFFTNGKQAAGPRRWVKHGGGGEGGAEKGCGPTRL